MDKSPRVRNVINIMFQRLLRESQGWEPDWERYKKWLKEKGVREAKRMVEAAAIEERRRNNDKVLRSYGLGKYQNRNNNNGW